MAFIQNQSLVVFEDHKAVSIFQCQYQRSFYNQEQFKRLEIAYPTSLNRAVLSRRAEFLAGRYAARQALVAGHHSVSDIKIGPDRCPDWPKGVVGSISHTDTHAYAAVADKNRYKYIGVDAEYVIDSAQVANIMSTVINQREIGLLRTCGLDFDPAVTLAFSMKESLFKALYPCVETYFDFKDVEITDVDIDKMTVEITVVGNIAESLQKNMLFKGYYKAFDSLILTLIACD
ncbi:MAG: 4'-phosphopantetheinyl transferase superfamily protein [Marinosulfonomonas sp.]|nr:4'-phosphopantetheinyl transferase superfamily protein [Marinosulfonomonas sp.]